MLYRIISYYLIVCCATLPGGGGANVIIIILIMTIMIIIPICMYILYIYISQYSISIHLYYNILLYCVILRCWEAEVRMWYTT